jgi:hypothetical protein
MDADAALERLEKVAAVLSVDDDSLDAFEQAMGGGIKALVDAKSRVAELEVKLDAAVEEAVKKEQAAADELKGVKAQLERLRSGNAVFFNTQEDLEL